MHESLSQGKPAASRPEIAIYRDREATLVVIIVMPIYVFVLVSLLIWLMLTASLSPFAFIESLLTILILIWSCYLFTTRIRLKRGPALVINSQGILIGAFPTTTSGRIFIPWEEIRSISLRRRFLASSVLTIRLKSLNYSLTDAHAWEHVTLRMRFFLGMPIFVFETYLDTPLKNVLLRMADLYARELREHRIQLQM